MPLDPRIALGVQQFQAPNMLEMAQNAMAVRNAQQTNQLNQMKLAAEQQSMDEANALRSYLASNPDLSSAEAQNRLVSQYGSAGLDILNRQQELANRRLAGQVSQQEYDANKHKQVQEGISKIAEYTNKADALKGLAESFEKGNIDEDSYNRLERQVSSTPLWADAKKDILFGMLTAEKQLEMLKPAEPTTTLGKLQAQLKQQQAAGDTVGAAQTQKAIDLELGGMTAAQKEQQRQFDITEKRLAEAAKDKNRPAEETNKESALAFLKTAGYNFETGEDEISKIIPSSAKAGAQKTIADVYKWITSNPTEGQKALSVLASRANKMVLDLLGSKLGAGISNSDVQFMQKTVGNIGDANATPGERLAAWTDLMDRMKKAAGVVAPSAATAIPMPGGAGAGAGTAPKTQTGVDMNNPLLR